MIDIPLLSILQFLFQYIIPTILSIFMMWTVFRNPRCIESWVLFFIGGGIMSWLLDVVGLLNITWS